MMTKNDLFSYYGIKISNEEEEEQTVSEPTQEGSQPTSGSTDIDDDSQSSEDTSEQNGSQPTSSMDSDPNYKPTKIKGGYQELANIVDEEQAKSQANSTASPTIVISAFVCSGKSTFAANCEYAKDLESSIFSKKPDGSKSEEFPGNYIAGIKWQLNNNNWKYLLVSSHQDVRKAMKEAGIKFYLFYPALERKDEIIKLCQERGNDAEFIQLLQENYEAWVSEMSKEENSYPLQEGEFLSMELFEKKYKFLYQ